MSYTEMFAAGEDGELASCAEFRNSWGSAPMVWDALARVYVPEETLSRNAWPIVWKREEFMRPFEVEALRTTYDRMVLRREHMLKAAESLDAFADRYQQDGYACSLRDQASEIRRQHEAGAIAIAWNQTSVGEAWCEEYDEAEDETVGYNVLTGDNHNTWEPATQRGAVEATR